MPDRDGEGENAVNLSEGIQLVSFGLLTALMLGSALGVVLARSVVYSAFLLGLTFTGMAGLYLLLNADFVAAAQILVYVGAVNVLILFGVMLVNKQLAFVEVPGLALRQATTALVCAGLFGLLSVVAVTTPWMISDAVPAADGSIVTIAQHLFSDFLLPFEVASVLLLMALIGAIVLARRDLLVDDPDTGMPDESDLTLPERPKASLSGSDG